MNLSPIAYKLAELLHDEKVTDLMAGSDATKDAATRMYFEALSPADRENVFHDVIAERLSAEDVLAWIGNDAAVGSEVSTTLYVYVEDKLREPVAIELERLQRDLNISRHVDQQIDEQKEKAA